jgi:hypothetical protein
LTGKRKEKKMKKKFFEFAASVMEALEYRLRLIVGKPTRAKKFIIVTALGTVLCIAFFYTLINSIYMQGKTQAQKEWMELQHIKPPVLKSDSTKQLKVKS